MRSELEQLAEIDQYLNGEMSAENAAAFEQKMQADPQLKNLVDEQQLLIQTVNRKAISAEIKAVAGVAGAAGSAGWGITQWVISGLTVSGIAVGSVFIYNAYTTSSEKSQSNNELLVTDEAASENETKTNSDTAEFMDFVLEVDQEDLTDEIAKEDVPQNGGDQPSENDSDNSSETSGGDALNTFSGLNQSSKKKQEITAESEDEESESTNIVKNRKAHFPGGAIDRKAWFMKHLMYPGTASKNELQATVRVKFYVEMTGDISQVASECFVLKDKEGQILSGIKRAMNRKSIKAFERQAAMAFRKNPDWLPATNTHGTPIGSWEVWYVNFVLNGKSSVYQLDESTGGRINEFQAIPAGEEEGSASYISFKTTD